MNIRIEPDGTQTYCGPPIHADSPVRDVRDALLAARTHPVPAVRDYLITQLTMQLDRAS